MKKFALTLLIASLLTSQWLTLTSAAYHEKLFDLVSKLPIEVLIQESLFKKFQKTEVDNKKLADELRQQKTKYQSKVRKARKLTQKVVKRTIRNVTANVSSVAVESVPMFGIATILAVTAMDIKDGCDTVRDTHELLSLMDESVDTPAEQELCGMTVPDISEIKIPTYKELIPFTHQK